MTEEKKKEKKVLVDGKMNLASSVMSSVKNGAISVFSAGFVNPHKKNITSDVKHFHVGEIGDLDGETKKFIKFDCEIDNIKVNFEINDVTDGVQKKAKKLKDDLKKTEQEKLGSVLGCKFKVISIYGYDKDGKRIKIGEVRNGGKKIKIDHKSLKEAGLSMTDLEKVLVGTGLAQEQAFSKLKEKIEKQEVKEKEAQEAEQKKNDEQNSEQEEQAQQKEKTQGKKAEQAEEKSHEKEQGEKESQENARDKSGQQKQGDSFDFETSRTIKETMDYLRKELRETEERLKDTDYTAEEKQGLEAHKQGLRETYEAFESANKKLSSLRTTKNKIKDKKVKTASRTETETDKNVKESQTVDKVNDNKEKNSERFQFMQEEANKKSRTDDSAVHQENEQKSERMKVMEENAKKNTMNSHQARSKDHKMKR
ncbi:MAG: hypothetical protein J6I35_04655 [Ruminobacter sp.]|uniref:hypothetical protein n=1 Tax=Ruminobacter sp. TaxID=2774296 RepID=UPI001B77C9C5|nr:hypothetical protein [Ruminobacter sp.]MBP3748828.1 hypothetical protein [Ruminobacter sp.]